MKNLYTEPKLNKTSKYWYIYYRYDGQQFRETNGLNKIADLKIREAAYNNQCKSISVSLKGGWNPNIPDGIQSQEEMFFIEALKFVRDSFFVNSFVNLIIVKYIWLTI